MMTYYVCKHCGNLIEMVRDRGVNPACCGEPMQKLTANTTEAATEKHIPAVTVSGDTVEVQVGSVLHPMEEKHWIEWITLETDAGVQRKALAPGKEPKASFVLGGDRPIAVYAFCNLHGLWKIDL